MSLSEVLNVVQSLPLSAAIRGDTRGAEWLFPIIETVHVLALALVFGSVTMMDLRLVGLMNRATSVVSIAKETLPLTWSAWLVAAATGTLMFMSKAVEYSTNVQFQLKMTLMLMAGVNMLIFHFGIYRRVAQWDVQAPPVSARLAGALSLVFWMAIVVFGRWIGFAMQD